METYYYHYYYSIYCIEHSRAGTTSHELLLTLPYFVTEGQYNIKSILYMILGRMRCIFQGECVARRGDSIGYYRCSTVWIFFIYVHA